MESLGSFKEIDKTLSQIEKGALYYEESLKEIEGVFKENDKLLATIPFVLPMSGRFTSGFGYRRCPFTHRRRFHEGIDIANNVGTSIYAPADGVVSFTGWKGGYGRLLKIRHGSGYETLYGHLSKILARKGERVKRGDLIALSGHSGRSTGPHLHYEIRFNKKPIDPWRCILY